MRMSALIVVLGLLAGPSHAAEPEFLPTEADAVGWAFQALQSYPVEDQPFIRFVLIPPWGDPDWIKAVDVAVNLAASQTAVRIRGDLHAGGWLIGYNLRRLAPDPKQLVRLIEVWDGIAIDEAKLHVPKVNLVDVVQQFDATVGGRVVKQSRTVKVQKRTAFLAPHLSAALARHVTDESKSQRVDVLVQQITQSTGAIYPADWFIEQLLTSAVGKYPEFLQIDFKGAGGFNPLQTVLKEHGFFLEQSVDFLGDKGAYLIASDVTGKNRIIIYVYGLNGRYAAFTTFDFKDSRTAANEQLVRNLIEFRAFADASETFIPKRNGLPAGVLADAKGNILRVAPPDVVADQTKPKGHTTELEMGMSCIMCHWGIGQEPKLASNGYNTRRNDLEFLLGSDIDFLGDNIAVIRSGKKLVLTREQAVEILSSRFGEPVDSPDGPWNRARRDLVRIVTEITGYPIQPDGKTAVQLVGEKIQEIYHGYRYNTIDAQRACLELGVRVEAAQARQTLALLVPPPPKGQQEDILISMLRNGASIKRSDMDAVFSEMARRAMLSREAIKKEARNNGT